MVMASHDTGTPPALRRVGIIAVEHGMLYSDIAQFAGWASAITHALLDGMRAAGVVMCPVAGDTATGHAALRPLLSALRDAGAEAIVIIEMHGDLEVQNHVALAMKHLAIPVIYVTWTNLQRHIPHIFYDNWFMGYQAAGHLVKAGYRSLIYLTHRVNDWIEQRYAGVEAAAQQARIPSTAVRFFPNQQAEGWHDPGNVLRDAAVRALIESGLLVTAAPRGIIAVNDSMALCLLRAAEAVGLRAGRDYGLIGFDNTPEAVEAGLSSLHIPLEHLGAECARRLTRALAGDPISLETRLYAEIKARASSEFPDDRAP